MVQPASMPYVIAQPLSAGCFTGARLSLQVPGLRKPVDGYGLMQALWFRHGLIRGWMPWGRAAPPGIEPGARL